MGGCARNDGRSRAGAHGRQAVAGRDRSGHVFVSDRRELPHRRAGYRHFQRLTTRWMDNDAYGHVNNVVYLSWFDTVVNAHLIENGALDIHHGETIGLVIETHCNY